MSRFPQPAYGVRYLAFVLVIINVIDYKYIDILFTYKIIIYLK